MTHLMFVSFISFKYVVLLLTKILVCPQYMYTGQVTVSQSNLNSFLKVAESLKVRGLVNHAFKIHHHPENPTSPASPDPDSSVPFRKRKRRLTTDFAAGTMHQADQLNDVMPAHPSTSREGPTDLSLPKLEAANAFFQPVIQTIAYSAIDPNNSNHSNQIYLKPKEALISPPLSDASEGGCAMESSKNNERVITFLCFPSSWAFEPFKFRKFA